MGKSVGMVPVSPKHSDMHRYDRSDRPQIAGGRVPFADIAMYMYWM